MTDEKKKNLKKEAISFFKDLGIVIIVVLIIRAFFAAPFQIKGASMDNNFYDREFILVNRLTTLDLPFIGKISPYKRGDVIVFEPRDKQGNLILEGESRKNMEDNFISKIRRFIAWPKTTYIKRIIGLPGDTIKIENGNVYLKTKNSSNFVKLNETFLSNRNYGNTRISFKKDEKEEFIVPEGKVFVMGDNRTNSTDSRICFNSLGCGVDFYSPFVDEKYIIGKVWFDMGYFSFEKFDFIHPVKGIDTHPRFFNFPKTFNYNLEKND